jgi:hydroxyquinol 1,2-dioxygenase
MLEAYNRSPWRPAHVHFVVSAEGYLPVTTHIFDSASPYLDDDAVFGEKNSLIVDFVEHETAGCLGETPPYVTASYDFVLAPARRC